MHCLLSEFWLNFESPGVVCISMELEMWVDVYTVNANTIIYVNILVVYMFLGPCLLQVLEDEDFIVDSS